MIKKVVLAEYCFRLGYLIRPRVLNTTIGYTGGSVIDPVYQNNENYLKYLT